MTLRFTPICFVCRFSEQAFTICKDYLHVALCSTKRSPFQAFGTRGLARYHHLGISTSPPLILNPSPSFPIHSPSQPLFLPPCASEPSSSGKYSRRGRCSVLKPKPSIHLSARRNLPGCNGTGRVSWVFPSFCPLRGFAGLSQREAYSNETLVRKSWDKW